MLKLPRLMTAIQRSWDRDTSHYKDWRPKNSAYGQCAVTALVVQDYLGGDIVSCYVGKYRHYYNEINKEVVDLTASQYAPYDPHYELEKFVDRKQLLRNELVRLRYDILRIRVEGILDETNRKTS